MGQKIQIKRGEEANLPFLSTGEPAITLDTERFFIGGQSGNIELSTKAVTDLISQVANLAQKRSGGFISVNEYDDLKVAVTGGYDYQPAIQAAINAAKLYGGVVLLTKSTYDIYSTLSLTDTVSLLGLSTYTDGTLINYKGTGGWAIKTSGLHQRNKISNIRLELNGNGNGIMLGEYYANLPAGQVPVQFGLESVVISGIGASYIGIATINASHYNFRDVRIGYGTTAGKGLYIYADNYNSGVATFLDCTLGRVDANSVGLTIDGTVNLDCFTFTGCYFGGVSPVSLGSTNTYIRNINFYGCHAEGRNTGGTVNIVEMFNVLGGNISGFTFAGFGAANTNGISMKGSVEKFNVMGCEANGMMGTMFLDNGATLIEDCMFQAPRLTNGATATIFSSGLSDKNFKYDVRKFTTENIRTKYLFSVDGANKEYWGTAPDATQAHTKGDIIKNTNPSRTKNITHWKCITTGGAGSGAFQAYGVGYGTTAERPTLAAADACYSYFDTTLAKVILWNGTAWQV